jgi:solute carrier family 26, other
MTDRKITVNLNLKINKVEKKLILLLVLQSIAKSIKSINIIGVIFSVCPLLKWLPRYSVKTNIIGDLIAGITTAILHIPQGMAYGLLAGLDPVAGLYMAFFPTLVYFIFGTSRHISTGTFSIASIMMSKIVATYSNPNYKAGEDVAGSYSNYEIATAVTLVCAGFQMIMYFLRLGIVASLLSEPLVSGFTTATGNL